MNNRQLALVKSINTARKLYLHKNVICKMAAKAIKLRNRVTYACDIGLTADIPLTCVFHHSGLGCVIGNHVKLGEGCQVYSNVVIGSKDIHGKQGANPTIGRNVVIGTGAIILGDITMGDDTIVAAGSVVLDSVPDHVMVAGNPAVVKKHYT